MTDHGVPGHALDGADGKDEGRTGEEHGSGSERVHREVRYRKRPPGVYERRSNAGWIVAAALAGVIILGIILLAAGLLGRTKLVSVPGRPIVVTVTSVAPAEPQPPVTVTKTPRPAPTKTVVVPSPVPGAMPSAGGLVKWIPIIPLTQARLNKACRDQYNDSEATAVLPPVGDDSGLHVFCVDGFGNRLGGLNLTNFCARYDGVLGILWIDVGNSNNPHYWACRPRHN